MATQKVSEMTAAVTAADADLVPIVQGGVNKKATVDLILDALTGARVAAAIGSTAANLVYAGPASGAAAVPSARSLVAADIPSLSSVYQPLDATLTALAALGAGPGFLQVTGADTFAIAALTDAQINTALGYTAANNASLANYLALAGGTLTGALVLSGAPTLDLHAATKLYVDGLISGKQDVDATLTALAALGAGPGFLQVTGADTFSIAALTDAQINAALGYTAANAAALNASNLTTGTIPDARFPAVLPAISGANLTNLPGGISGLTAGVIPVATSATAIANSKWTMSGTNLGTATLWDDTATVGSTNLRVRRGAGQTGPEFLVDNAGGAGDLFSVNGFAVDVGAFGAGVRMEGNLGVITLGAGGLIQAYGYANFPVINPSLKWPDATSNVGLNYSAPGILKVTDGSTGYGRLLAGSLGVNNSAAGSTPGTCVKKIEVFDAAGASLGFVPVYDAIT